MTESTRNKTKIPRQWAKNRIPCPSAGASTDENENGHDERHDPGHGPAFVLIADQGDRHRSRPGRADPLQNPARQHGGEIRRDDGQQAAQHEQDQPGVDGGFAADAVRQRAKKHLPQREAEEKRRQDQLIVVGLPHTQVAANLRQRRDHRVRRQGDERNQQRHQGDKLGERARARPWRLIQDFVLDTRRLLHTVQSAWANAHGQKEGRRHPWAPTRPS